MEISNFNILQQLKVTNENNWQNLAEISESMDEKDKAIICYESAINNNPPKTNILNKLASIYQEEDKYEEVIFFYYFHAFLKKFYSHPRQLNISKRFCKQIKMIQMHGVTLVIVI